MASILDRYGIKEVADLTFYSIDGATGRPRTPVLYIDTAKVSTLEQTAENTYATGGKGNAKLIGWDFGKEITLNIEDAVFSPKSLSVMFGDGTVDTEESQIDITATAGKLYKTFIWTCDKVGAVTDGKVTASTLFGTTSPLYEIHHFAATDMVAVTAETSKPGSDSADIAAFSGNTVKGNKYFISVYVQPTTARVITVGPDTFPGTYYITGDTYARSEADGTDEYFQFIVPKGKVTSENTITMEADGDPSVFNMTVDVMRATVGGENVMMKLVQYGFGESAGDDTSVVLDSRLTSGQGD